MYWSFIRKICIPFNKIYTEPSSGVFWNSVYLNPLHPTIITNYIKNSGKNCNKLLQIFIGHRENNKFKKDYNYSKFQLNYAKVSFFLQ
jgi:hypothetical protein